MDPGGWKYIFKNIQQFAFGGGVTFNTFTKLAEFYAGKVLISVFEVSFRNETVCGRKFGILEISCVTNCDTILNFVNFENKGSYIQRVMQVVLLWKILSIYYLHRVK